MTGQAAGSVASGREGILIVISGFAGTGKGTIVKGLLEKYPEEYALSVSMTTRAPRPGEVDGVSYFFVSKERFAQVVAQDGLVEHARYCDNDYGTPRAYVEEQLKKGKDVILEIEIQGAMKVRERFPSALLLFVMPPSAAELERRLVGRGTETADVVRKRMRRAAQEAEGIERYDYLVINDDVESCVEATHAIISSAHAEPSRNMLIIEQMREQLKAYCESSM